MLLLGPSGAFCLRQMAQRAALRAAGQATSGKSDPHSKRIDFKSREGARARAAYNDHDIVIDAYTDSYRL